MHRPSLSLTWTLKHPVWKQHPTDMNTYSITTAFPMQLPHSLLFLPQAPRKGPSFPLFLLCVYWVTHAANVILQSKEWLADSLAHWHSLLSIVTLFLILQQLPVCHRVPGRLEQVLQKPCSTKCPKHGTKHYHSYQAVATKPLNCS